MEQTPMDMLLGSGENVSYTQNVQTLDLYETGSRVVKAFGTRHRFFHFEFFRLDENKEGLGLKGDLLGLEVNMRAPGGYIPPTDVADLWRFIDEIPYWTAQKHGKKYRLMYQVYTHPKYRQYGKEFFEGVDKRYTQYARGLESKLGIPSEKLVPLIFILIRACVHYALFEDEFYLHSQIDVLKESLVMFMEKYRNQSGSH